MTDLHARLVAALRARLEVARAALEVDLREQLAAIEHERWASWQKWMHGQCRLDDRTHALMIPATLVARWEQQIATPFAELTEREKDSDRAQVDRYLPLVFAATDPATEIRRVEALLRVVERHRPIKMEHERIVCDACMPSRFPCDDIRDLAAGEGIEVET